MSRFHEYMANRQPQSVAALDIAIPVTFFDSFAATSKRETRQSLRELVDTLKFTSAASKEALPWLKLAEFGDKITSNGSYRHNANVVSIHGIEADYDGEQITIERARQVLQGADIAAVLYTSPSNTHERPRWRVLCPTSGPVDSAGRNALVARVNGLFVGALAGESFTLSQSYYYGYVEGAQAHQVVTIEGRTIDQASDLDHGAIGRPQKAAAAPIEPQARTSTDGGTHYGLAALDDECNAIRWAGEGSKHFTLNKAAYAIGGLVAAKQLDRPVAFNALAGALNDIRQQCKDFKAAERTLRNSFNDGMNAPRAVPDRPIETPEVHPAAAFLAKLQSRSSEKTSKPLPVSSRLLDVDGVLKLFVDHCEATAISPQPFLALAAGICAVGALAGRRYRTRTNLRTNIYAVGIADSGGGKDHARKQIKAILNAAGLTRYLGGEDVASGAAMLTALARHPAILFQIDEFGDWLAGVLGKNASPHKRAIAEKLKALYSSADSFIAGTEYANQSKQTGREREDIQNPHACLYGTTTPGQFWAAIASGSMHDGLMARVLICVSERSYPDEADPDYAAPSAELIEAFQAVARGAEAQAGDLTGLAVMDASIEPETYCVDASPDAEAAIKALRAEQLAWARQKEGTYVTAIVARWAENATKLALVRAVSRDPAWPTITVQDVAWGRAFSKHCIDTLLTDADRYVSDNETEAKSKRVLQVIVEAGEISLSELALKTRNILRRDRMDILASLQEMGLITETKRNNEGTRQTTLYRGTGVQVGNPQTQNTVPSH